MTAPFETVNWISTFRLAWGVLDLLTGLRVYSRIYETILSQIHPFFIEVVRPVVDFFVVKQHRRVVRAIVVQGGRER